MANVPFQSELYQSQLVDPQVWQATPAISPTITGYALPPTNLTAYGSKWRGAAVPLSKRKDGRFGVKYTNDLVKASILMIYTTRVGSRLMNPLFGSHFLDVLFEPNDSVLRAEVVVYMTNAINQWEPRINLLGISVYSNEANILIHHNYQIRESGQAVDMYLQAQKGVLGSLRIVDNVG